MSRILVSLLTEIDELSDGGMLTAEFARTQRERILGDARHRVSAAPARNRSRLRAG